jgi:asparagine synthase (glutamine-hydrolysing)
MCGYIAVLGNESETLATHQFSESYLNLRGPDGSTKNVFRNSLVYFYRLAINDLSINGLQPFIDKSSGSWLVCNGEIYNYKELCLLLEESCLHLASRSDVEILFKLLLERGIAAIDLADGMFSFVFYDGSSNTFYFGRDPFGQKPLYYSNYKNSMVLGSDLHALSSLTGHCEIDIHGINQYLCDGFIPSPCTIVQNIGSAIPGLIYRYSPDLNRVAEVFRISKSYNQRSTNKFDQKKCFESLVMEVTNAPEVERVLLLSGGVDSSLVASLNVSQSDEQQKIECFSASFNDPLIDESSSAKNVANQIGLTLTTLDMTNFDKSLFHEYIASISEPLANHSIYTQFKLIKKIKVSNPFVKVVLTGDGGDENFLGYPHYSVRRDAPRPTGFNKLLFVLLTRAPYQHIIVSIINKLFKSSLISLLRNRYMTPRERVALCPLLRSRVVEPISPEQNRLSAYSNQKIFSDPNLFLDWDYTMLNDYMPKADISGMLNSIELRPALISRKIFRFANELPDNLKILKGERKVFLRKTLSSKGIFVRSGKYGFVSPVQLWRDEIRKILQESSSYAKLFEQSLINSLYWQTFSVSRPVSYRASRQMFALAALVSYLDQHKLLVNIH